MQSQPKLASMVGRDGIAGGRGERQEKEVPTVEVDATFARLLGLSEGMKVQSTRRCRWALKLESRRADTGIVGWRGIASGSAAGTYGQH